MPARIPHLPPPLPSPPIRVYHHQPRSITRHRRTTRSPQRYHVRNSFPSWGHHPHQEIHHQRPRPTVQKAQGAPRVDRSLLRQIRTMPDSPAPQRPRKHPSPPFMSHVHPWLRMDFLALRIRTHILLFIIPIPPYPTPDTRRTLRDPKHRYPGHKYPKAVPPSIIYEGRSRYPPSRLWWR